MDLDLPYGEVLGLAGPNGAGKSTLLKILAGTLLPSAGTGNVAGHALTDDRDVKAAVGLASGDDRGFYGRLSGRQNLWFFGALRDIGRAELTRRVERAIARFKIQDFADRAVQKYSTGQRQRLSLARATLHEPRILLLDEPTRGLDGLMAESVETWLRTWLGECPGRAALLVTHDLEQIERTSERAGILVAGRLVLTKDVADLRAERRTGASSRLHELMRELVTRPPA